MDQGPRFTGVYLEPSFSGAGHEPKTIGTAWNCRGLHDVDVCLLLGSVLKLGAHFPLLFQREGIYLPPGLPGLRGGVMRIM